MIEENASKLWKIIQEAGDYLSDQRFTLTDLDTHELCGLLKIHKK